MEHAKLPWDDGTQVDALRGEILGFDQIIGVQEICFQQCLGTDQVIVASESGETLVWRITVPGWAKGQHLPETTAAFCEEFQPLVRLRPNVAAPGRTRTPGERMLRSIRAPDEITQPSVIMLS